MSYATLLAADRPMPELRYEAPELETTIRCGRTTYVECPVLFILPNGFDLLKCCCETRKMYFYFLNFDDLLPSLTTVQTLKAYLSKHLAEGESVELWGIWEGEYPNEQGELVFVEDYAKANRSPIRRTITVEQLSPDDLSLLGRGSEEQSVCITVRR